jgi:hypothetical protein
MGTIIVPFPFFSNTAVARQMFSDNFEEKLHTGMTSVGCSGTSYCDMSKSFIATRHPCPIQARKKHRQDSSW